MNLVEVVAKEFGVSVEDLIGLSTDSAPLSARRAFAILARGVLSNAEVYEVVGRHRPAVSNLRRYGRRDPEVMARVAHIRENYSHLLCDTNHTPIKPVAGEEYRSWTWIAPIGPGAWWRVRCRCGRVSAIRTGVMGEAQSCSVCARRGVVVEYTNA